MNQQLPQPELLGKISWRDVLNYFWRDRSLFRQYQDLLLQRFGSEFTGRVTEIGCELHYQHQRHFLNASEYHCTNVGRDYDEYLDVTNMDKLDDNSQDGFICISVLEHVFDFEAAIKEMERTLKPGGKLLLALPFAFPLHDEVDYWRFSRDTYFQYLEPGYEIQHVFHLGTKFSAFADEF